MDFVSCLLYNEITKALLNIFGGLKMSIGSTIKQLRKREGITQEQLAECLGITSRAISQWECERTTPDITLIPALCHVFGVSSDELLEIDIHKSSEEIKKYLDKATEFCYQGKWDDYSNILREANKKFPRDYRIMLKLSNALINEYSRKKNKDYKEVFELCNRILAECTDSNIRYEATDILATAFGYAGKNEEMLKLANEMPKSHLSYENFMLYHWKGNEGFAEMQEYIHFLINSLLASIDRAYLYCFDNGKLAYSKEENIELCKLQVKLLEVLFPNKDYQYFAQVGEIACNRILITYIRNGDIEGAWHWLEKSVEFAIHMDTYNFEEQHVSLILRGYSSGGWIMETCGNMSCALLEWLTTDEEISVLRSDPRFKSIVNRLKMIAKK